MKKDALKLYLEVKSISRVSDETGIPISTIDRWRNQYKWDKEIKKNELMIVNDAIDIDKTVEDLCERFNIPVNDGEILKQVKQIEKICLKAIKNKFPEDDKTLKPLTFDGAMKSLKVCWEFRLKLFPRIPKDAGTVTEKVSYVAAVHNYYNKEKNEDNKIQDFSSKNMVSGLLSDRERSRDNQSE